MPNLRPLLSTILLFFLFFSTSVFSKPTVDDYGQLASVSKMAISDDGEKIAFRKFDGKRDWLVVYSLHENKVLRAVDLSAVNPQTIYFINDSKLILRVAEHRRISGFKGAHDVSAAYVLDVDSGQLEQLLKPGDKIYTGQTNVGAILGVSPDQKTVYMPAYIDQMRYGVMQVNLESPARPKKIYRGHRHAIDYFMGSDGEILVQERYSDYSDRHQILVKKSGKWKVIFEQEAPIRNIVPVGLTPDYRHLVVLSYKNESDYVQYFTMSLEDGKVSDPGLNRDDADIQQVITDINRVAYGVEYGGIVPSFKLFDGQLDQRIKKIVQKFSGNSVRPVSWSRDWGQILVLAAGTNHPREYFLFDHKLEAKFVGSSRTNITPTDVHPIATVTVTARDGMKIPTLLTIPRDKVEKMKSLPAVMLPHGGPNANDQIGFDVFAQALANEGYLVIQPQFRGSSGFGYAHTSAGYGEWGGKMQDDLTDAVGFLTGKGMVDKNRICIAGLSYGGYAALAGGALTPDLYRCVVAINGVSDLWRMLAEEKTAHGRYSWVLTYWEKFIANGDPDKSRLRSVSPYHLAEQFKAPVLLIHAENDDRVRFEQSKIMAKSLKKNKKSVRLIKLKDENHHLVTNAGHLKTVRETVKFVKQNLR